MEQVIHTYVVKNHPTICLICNVTNNKCSLPFMSSLIESKDFLNKFNIPLFIELNTLNNDCTSKNKNDILAKACDIPNITHILYVKENVCWTPIDIVKLLLSNKNIVGGVMHNPHFKWETIINNPNVVNDWIQLSELKNLNNSPEETAHYHLLDYNIKYIDNNLDIENGTAKIDQFNLGFTMFKINMIKQMQCAFPRTKYVCNDLPTSVNENAFFLFNSGIEKYQYYNDEQMFCKRWKKMGGSAWINVTINLTITDEQYYKGSFYNSITQI